MEEIIIKFKVKDRDKFFKNLDYFVISEDIEWEEELSNEKFGF